MNKPMTTTEAFQHFIDNKLYSEEVLAKYSKGTQASWKNRFKADALTDGIMSEKLSEFGYVKTDEGWLIASEQDEFVSMLSSIKSDKNAKAFAVTTESIMPVTNEMFVQVASEMAIRASNNNVIMVEASGKTYVVIRAEQESKFKTQRLEI